MVDLLGARVAKPLEPHAVGYGEELARQGYTVHTMRQQLGLVAHLSCWMAEQRVDVVDLSPLRVEKYFRLRRERGYRNFRSPKASAPLLSYLRGLGAVLEASPELAQKSSSAMLPKFRDYLVGERGLGVASARGYVDLVAEFVERCMSEGEDLSGLTTSAVTAFLVEQSRRLSPKTL